MDKYDVIVIGAGHAGIEAALACSRMDCRTLMVTLNKETIGLMSCNPAIGGVGKGQLVKEIDALGGEMAKAADACGIQFRILNASKGAAVHSSRAQIDMRLYNQYMRDLVLSMPGITVKEAEIKALIIENSQVVGVKTHGKEEIIAKAVVICPGTFLDGLIHVGLNHKSGGRIDEPASVGLAQDLKDAGFTLLRFKTGTCPRLDKRTIDFSKLIVQNADHPPQPFSFSTKNIPLLQVPCHITYTNPAVHQIIADNLDRSPMYSGKIKATGVRYCPSIEDKIVKFADKSRHQVFLEPQGLDTDWIYPNGLSTSLPEDVQLKMLHAIEGLENVSVLRFGYGIEHTVVDSTQLFPSLETKLVRNLFLAGQINGTTGYEEAAAQGLIAGINAALRVKNKELFILDRASSYIGVLLDDLTTKGTEEPYRMFTSRVEYRFLLREDNADLRLGKLGFALGLVSEKNHRRTENKQIEINQVLEYLKKTRIKSADGVNQILSDLNTSAMHKPLTLEEVFKRPQVSLEGFKRILNLTADHPKISDQALQQLEIEVKYAGFIQRQLAEVDRFENLEKIKLPADLEYLEIPSLSREIKEKLKRFKPFNLGQASRISGMTPAAISILMVYLRKISGKK